MESDCSTSKVCTGEDNEGYDIAAENTFCIEDSHPQQMDLTNFESSAEEDGEG